MGAPKDRALKEKDACPVTVREGRAWLDGFAAENAVHTACGNTQKPKPFSDAKDDTPAVLVRDVWFRYEQNQPDVLKGLSFRVEKGQLYAIVGGNGTGKSTALSVISGVRSAYCGTVRLCGKTLPGLARTHEKTVCILPQDPQALFVRKTVALDLADMLSQQRLTQEQKDASVNAVARLCGLENLLQRHPYDLSGGEQQRAALAKVLLLKPKILLLDEPTKGLDAHFKQTFAAILASLTSSGVTVIMVSHDIEFCARYADRCAMFFDGGIVSEGTPREFFAGKSFYTTAANRMARHLLPEAILAEDIVRACISGGTASGDFSETPNATPPEPLNGAPTEIPNGTPSDSSNSTSSAMPDAAPQNGLFDFENLDFLKQTAASDRNGAAPSRTENAAEPLSQTLSDKRKMPLKRLCGILFAVLFVLAGMVCAHSPQDWQLTLARLLSVLCAALALGCLLPQKTLGSSDVGAPMPKERLSARTWAGIAASLAAVPLTVLVGVYGFGDRKYYFISLLILLETMLPFFLSFEGRKPKAREIVLISVLCAVGVAGRAAFFMLPQFKPVAAVVILAGVCLGGESGFLVGAVTAFVSNFFFGQGPWTPWQMFAFGFIGLLGGVLFRKGALRRTKLALCVFGGLAVLVLYGGILNTASVLMIQSVPTVTQLVSAYAVGFPFDLVHAVSTVFFLWFAAEPMIEKIERVKRKYGLMENGASPFSLPRS
ncbi:MAG: ATP-binding cassette domain-containing protein, partial [Eubacteriales bacterium]